VGSTSIINCYAKPIIDISIKVSDFNNINEIIQKLKKDYTYKGNAGVEGRHFFVKGTSNSRTHYIHIVPDGSNLWNNHICFRDYLNLYQQYVTEYSAIKLKLQDKFADDRKNYSLAKSNFIVNVTSKAKEFYNLG